MIYVILINNESNKENIKSYTHSLNSTHNVPYSSTPSIGKRHGLAASTILRTCTMTEQNRMKWSILESGASSSFLLSAAPVHDKEVATTPLSITLPDGSIIYSSHTANIALPQLPPMARLAHIVPGLSSHNLVSVVKLCNAGCKVVMLDISCEVQYRGKTVIKCSKDVNTGLWMILCI